MKVDSAAICHTDINIKNALATHVCYPVVPGHEFSGTVVKKGVRATCTEVGCRGAVHSIMGCGGCPACRMGDTMGCTRYNEFGSKCNGGFAEYVIVPERFLLPLPDEVSLEEGALLEPLANVANVMERVAIRPGEDVLIIGPGAIGLLCAMASKLFSPRRLVVAGTRSGRLAVAKACCGATHTVNVNDEDCAVQVSAALPTGADVVIECAGSVSALTLGVSALARNGRMAIEGTVTTGEALPLDSCALQGKQASIIGVGGWQTSHFQTGYRWVCSRLLNVSPLITHRYSLSDWRAAFHTAEFDKDAAIRVLLKPNANPEQEVLSWPMHC